jgi:carboxypeptidase family protein/TonB-dependent receptor-like protein
MSREARRWTVFLPCLLLAALVVIFAFPQRGSAQVLYGSILGDVKDATGASIRGATVVALNKSTGLARQGITDGTGRFNFSDLPAGVYSLKASQQGFKTFEQTEVTVNINSVARVDVTLQIGSMGDTVTVSAEPPKLQTETAEVHVNLMGAELTNLPVPLGRNYQQVYRMLPGFAPPSNSHSIPTNPARSLEFTVNGTSDDQNNTRIDGVSTAHIQLPHVVSYIPTLESIQEVNVVTNSMDAEQGLAGGAAVNVQTRSGSNAIHGSAFEHHTDQHLKAWPMRFGDVALNTGDKPQASYDQFGGTIGGPIKKNKAFFFVSYESTRDHRTVDTTVTVPTVAMLRGDLSLSPTPIYDPLSGNPDGSGRTQFRVVPGDPNYALCNRATNPNCLNIIPAARMDPIAKKIASFIPANNIDRERDNYFISGPFAFDRHQVDSKFDYNVNSKLNLAGTFGFLHYRTNVPTVFGDAAVGEPIGGSSNPGQGHGNTYRLTVMGTYIFSPNFLLDAHYGWARQGTASEQPGLGQNIGLDVLGIPGTNGPRRFESGWPSFEFGPDSEDFARVGINENFMPYYRHDPQSQYVVNFNLTKRKHNIRFGADVYQMALNQAQAEFITGGFGAQGGFGFDRGITVRCEVVDPVTGNCEETSSSSRYNSIAGFLIGQASRSGRTLQVPDEYHLRARLFSAYARDRWAATDKLTIDYGLRWEYFPIPTRPDRGIERYDVDTGKVLLCGIGSVPKDCGFETSKTGFAPRIGLAYRLGDKSVLRAGYGLTRDPYEAMELIRANYPILIQVKRESPDGLTPTGSLSQGVPPLQVPAENTGILDIPSDYAWGGYPTKLNRGYIQSWNLTFQRELPWSFTGQVGYVATRSIRQLGLVDINAGQVIGAGDEGKPLLARFGRTASTVLLEPVGNGRYDSLQVQLQRRFTAGLSLNVSYTWGKAISPNENSSFTPNVQAVAYMSRNRALTSTDRTHNLGITNVWEIPLGKGRRWLNDNGVLSRILGGWQVNNMISVMSGVPFTVLADDTSLNLPGSNQTADQVKAVQKLGGVGRGTPYYDPTAFADVTAARFGNTGYNMLRGPGLFNWDFGLTREFPLSKAVKLQLRLEAFNLTNTPHLALPDNSVGDGEDFMTITSVQDLSREGIDERQLRVGLRVVF